MPKKFDQAGIAPLIIVVIIGAVIAAAAAFAWITTKPKKSPESLLIQTSPLPEVSISPLASALPTSTPKPSAKPTITPVPMPSVTSDVISNGFICGDGPGGFYPAAGITPLPVYLYPTAGVDGTGDYIAGYQWDYDGNGSWDSDILSDAPVTHTYTQAGAFVPRYRIRGTKGTWSKACRYLYTVYVDPGTSTRGDISVSSPHIDVTVSKSNVNFDLVRNDHGNPISGYVYGPGFNINLYTISSWRLKNPDGSDQSVFESNGTLYPGTQQKVHVALSSALEPQVFSGTVVVQFFQNNQWLNGPTVSYNVTLTN